jgi:hypothetical protein
VIPLLVVPVVQGVLGQVMGMFSPSAPPASATPSTSFANSLASATAAPSFSSFSSGTMRSGQWNQMGASDLSSWTKGLQGSHVDATDDSGRTISGTVSGMQMMGNTMALNIGGHLVSLSQLKQITWSPSVA